MILNRLQACILWLLISALEAKPARHRVSSRRSSTSEAPDEVYSASLEIISYSNQNTTGNTDESLLKNINDFNDKYSDDSRDTPAKATDDDIVDSDTRDFFKQLMDGTTDETSKVDKNWDENLNDARRFEENESGRFGNQQDANGAFNEITSESAASNEASIRDGTETNYIADFKSNIQSDLENNATESMAGSDNKAHNTSQSTDGNGPHHVKKSERKLMAHKKKQAHSLKDLRKTDSKSNKTHRQVTDRSHHVSPKAVINKILNMMQIPNEDTITTTQWNNYTDPFEEFTNHGRTSERSLTEDVQISSEVLPMHLMSDITTKEGIFTKQRSINNPNTFNSGTRKLKLNSLKHSSQVRKKVKLIDDYHVKEEDLFMEPDLNLEETRPTKSTSPSKFLIKTTQRSKVNSSTNISKYSDGFPSSFAKTTSHPKSKKYPELKSNNLSTSKTKTQPLSAGLKKKVLSSPEKSQLTTSRYIINPKHKSVSYSSPFPFNQKANYNNQDDALVIVLRFPQLVLRDLSKVISYGMEQNNLKSAVETNTQFVPTFGKIRKGKELGGNTPEKQLNDSAFTTAQTNATNSNEFIISPPSNSINVRLASGHTTASLQKKNADSTMSKWDTSVPSTEGGNLKREKEKSGVLSSSLSSMLNGGTLSQQLTTESHLERNDARNHMLSSLLSMLNQLALPYQFTTEQPTENQNVHEKERGGLLSTLSAILNKIVVHQQASSEAENLKSLKALGNQTNKNRFEENRPQRQAPDFKAELQVFRQMISSLVTRLTDYIEKKPNLTQLQKEFSLTYMKRLLPEMVVKHMDELIKEIHNVAGKDRDQVHSSTTAG